MKSLADNSPVKQGKIFHTEVCILGTSSHQGRSQFFNIKLLQEYFNHRPLKSYNFGSRIIKTEYFSMFKRGLCTHHTGLGHITGQNHGIPLKS